MVRELLTNHIIELLPGLGCQAHQELVQLPRHVHQLRVEEGGGEGNTGRLPSVQVTVLHQAKYDNPEISQTVPSFYSLQETLDQSVTKSEGCRGETVDYGGIGERIVPRGTL